MARQEYIKSVNFNLFSMAQAYCNCKESGNTEWQQKHFDRVKDLLLEFLPHGSGIDCDWQFEICSGGNNFPAYIKISNSWHCMDQNGMYCGYIPFRAILRSDYSAAITCCEQSKKAILSDYDDIEDPNTGEIETNAPYLEDLPDFLTEAIEHSLELIEKNFKARQLIEHDLTLVKCLINDFEFSANEK